MRGFCFWGSIGYYKRFIKNYAAICRPLIDLLKKDNFHWSTLAIEPFEQLKIAMTTPIVLVFPNFSHDFVIETNASSFGIGVVLMQQSHPIAFISKALSPQNQRLLYMKKRCYHHLCSEKMEPLFELRVDILLSRQITKV